MAGFLIAGSTLHSLLRLPVRQGKNLQGQSLKALQTSLAGVKYIIIDELSMVSQAQFAWVDRRLRQGTAVDEPFGGISVIMTGDLGQLQPVGGTPLYKQNPTAALNVEGYAAYSGFKDVFILDRVQRQTAAAANDDDQRGFIELLPRARDGRLTQEDWELLLKRQPNSLTSDEKAEFEDATRLFFPKREVNRFNGKKLRELEKPVARVSAVHTGANARRASADTAEGLERDLYLAKGAKVMLTKNLYQQVGLVNGIRGEVVELVYTDDAPPPKLPLYVVVKFRGYSGGEWSSQERYRGCVPISPVDTTWQDGGTQVRTQLPLRLCWAITMHKSQGQTLDKAVIDSLPPAVLLAITPTFRPWTHTSDDSYIYQLSLVLATAIVSFKFQRLVGLSFFFSCQNVVRFYLASPHVRTPPKRNLVIQVLFHPFFLSRPYISVFQYFSAIVSKMQPGFGSQAGARIFGSNVGVRSNGNVRSNVERSFKW